MQFFLFGSTQEQKLRESLNLVETQCRLIPGVVCTNRTIHTDMLYCAWRIGLTVEETNLALRTEHRKDGPWVLRYGAHHVRTVRWWNRISMFSERANWLSSLYSILSRYIFIEMYAFRSENDATQSRILALCQSAKKSKLWRLELHHS